MTSSSRITHATSSAGATAKACLGRHIIKHSIAVEIPCYIPIQIQIMQHTTKFITKCSTQHHQLRKCMQKHWHLLSEDPILKKYVRETPEIAFPKTTSIGSKNHNQPIQDPRGGNWDKRILQKETLWIERLETTKSPGISEVLSYRPFLCLSPVIFLLLVPSHMSPAYSFYLAC